VGVAAVVLAADAVSFSQQGIINWGGGHQSDVKKCDDGEETHLGRVVRLKFDLVS